MQAVLQHTAIVLLPLLVSMILSIFSGSVDIFLDTGIAQVFDTLPTALKCILDMEANKS